MDTKLNSQWIAPESIDRFIIHPYFKFIVIPHSLHQATLRKELVNKIAYELHRCMPNSILVLMVQFVLLFLFCSLRNNAIVIVWAVAG